MNWFKWRNPFAKKPAPTPVVDTVPPPSRLPLGLRQNNPGNLRPLSNGAWRGQTGVANGFCVFSTADEGIRACALNLRNYQKFHGIDTIAEIVQRYAPAADSNDEAAYIASLVKQTGWGEDKQLNLFDRATLANLVRAIIKHEQGLQPFPPGVIQANVDEALRA